MITARPSSQDTAERLRTHVHELASIIGERHVRQRQALQPSSGLSVLRITTRIPATGDPELLPLLEQQQVEIDVLPAAPKGLSQLLISILPWAILIGIYWFFWRRVTRSFGGFGRRIDPNEFLSGSPVRHRSRGAGPSDYRNASHQGRTSDQ